MPYRLFHSGQYDADAVQLMSRVFDEVCAELGLANREDRLRDMVAFEIVQCLEKGDRDPASMRACARKALHMPQDKRR
jgi:hypothetical protein